MESDLDKVETPNMTSLVHRRDGHGQICEGAGVTRLRGSLHEGGGKWQKRDTAALP